jgi:hypothetical protein
VGLLRTSKGKNIKYQIISFFNDFSNRNIGKFDVSVISLSVSRTRTLINFLVPRERTRNAKSVKFSLFGASMRCIYSGRDKVMALHATLNFNLLSGFILLGY